MALLKGEIFLQSRLRSPRSKSLDRNLEGHWQRGQTEYQYAQSGTISLGYEGWRTFGRVGTMCGLTQLRGKKLATTVRKVCLAGSTWNERDNRIFGE